MTQSGIRYATKEDVPRIHQLIKDLAEYEKAPLEAKATIQQIEETIFGDNPVAYCHVAEDNGLVVGISIWFLNYSTWVGKPGIYLEDLYIDPAYRGKGYGLAFLKELGKICVERDYERLQWWVLDWNFHFFLFRVNHCAACESPNKTMVLSEVKSPYRHSFEV